MDSVEEIRNRLDGGRFSIRQILIVLVCFLANFVDGYDVIAIAMAAPRISEEWGIAPEFLGYILSAELVGMAVGAIVLAALSDKYGRRTVLLPSIFLVTASTFLTAYADSPMQLIIARLATGLGVGGVLTAAATLASEFSPSQARAAVVTFVTMGFSVGSLLAGVVAAHSLEHFNWPMIFLVGSAMGVVILLLAVLFVPESMEFTATRPDASERRQAQINRTLSRLGFEPLTHFSAPEQSGQIHSSGPENLLSSEFLKVTLILWALFFAIFWASYGAGKWLPKLLVNDGFELTDAVFALTVWVLGGTLGSLSCSLLSFRFSIERVIAVLLAGSAVLVMLYAVIQPETIRTLYALLFVLGLGISGAMTAMYSIPVTHYPINLRSLGLGCCIGIGRIGAIVAPIAAGYLVGDGADTTRVLLIVTLPSVLIGFFIVSFAKMQTIPQSN